MNLVTPGYHLGIDYGTSNTVAMLRWPDGTVRPLLFDGSPLLPSAVFATADGSVLTGRDAVRSARLAPASYEPHVKRRIDDLDVLLGDRTYPVVDLVAATLRRVVTEAPRATGALPASVCITCPVAWGPARRAALTEAAAAAGLPQPVLVPEPVAAASYLAASGGGVRPHECMVVYDLGAGTFDVSVVSHTSGGFETLSSRGLDDFGGLDLDALVVAFAGRLLAARAPDAWRRLSGPASSSELRSFRELWDDAREAKEALSRQATAGLHVAIADTDVMVTREEFDRAALPLLSRTVEVTELCIREARVPRERIASVFLVGGGSRTPMVATLLHRKLGLPPTVTDQPEMAVAEGALALISPVRDPLHPVPAAARPVGGLASGTFAAPAGFAPPPAGFAPPPARPSAGFAPPPAGFTAPPGGFGTVHGTAPEQPGGGYRSSVDTGGPEEFASRRWLMALPGTALTLLGFVVALVGLMASADNLAPTETTAVLYLVLVPAGTVLTAGLTLIARAVQRLRLRIGPDGIVVSAGSPAGTGILRIAGPVVSAVTLLLAGLLLSEEPYSYYGRTGYVLDSTAYDGVALLFCFVAVGWTVVAAFVARSVRRRNRRWRRDIAVDPTTAGPARAEWRFPWAAVERVTVRRIGVRRAKTVLATSPSGSELFRDRATGDRYRPGLEAFAVCDLSAAALPVNEVTVALRRHCGSRWRDA